MAGKKSGTGANKVSFGKRKGRRAKKSYGPKEQRPKKYRSQGR